MKILFLIFVLFTSAAAQEVTIEQLQTKANKKIEITYDKFKDKTFVKTRPVDLVSGGEKFAAGVVRGSDLIIATRFALTAGFAFEGNTLKEKPTHYLIALVTASNKWMFLNESSLYILYDNERVELKALDRQSSIQNRGVAELMAYIITAEKLEKIANAKNVEVKASIYSKPLKKEFLESLRNLIALSKIN